MSLKILLKVWFNLKNSIVKEDLKKLLYKYKQKNIKKSRIDCRNQTQTFSFVKNFICVFVSFGGIEIMTTTLKHHWWRPHRESRWVCTLHTAHDSSLSGLQTGLHAGYSQTLYISGFWDWQLPVLHLWPRCRGHTKKNLHLTQSPTNETGYFTLRKQPIRTVSGYGDGSDRAEHLWWVLQASSRKPLYCWRRAHQWRMSQIPPASIGLYYIRIIILKCTLMLKKSLLQNFKATIKYSIVMAQLNGLAWENWGL